MLIVYCVCLLCTVIWSQFTVAHTLLVSYHEVDNQDTEKEPAVIILVWQDDAVRRKFVQKVFGLMTAMLLVVTLMGSVTVFSEAARKIFREHWYIGILAAIIFLVVYLLLVCVKKFRSQFPLNLILLIVLSFSMGFLVMSNCAHMDPATVVLIFLVTTLTCTTIICFASFTKMKMDGCIFIAASAGLSAVLFVAGAVCIAIFAKPTNIWNLLICGIFCVIWMIFLALDVRSIVRGRERGVSVQPDEVVLGAVVLFTDIVNIFFCLMGVASN